MMTAWSAFLGVAYCGACLCFPGFRADRWTGRIAPAWKQSPFVGIVLALLAFASYPVGWFVDRVIDKYENFRRVLLELWVLYWTGVTFLLLFHGVDSYPWLVFVPLLVLLDSLYVILSLLVLPPPAPTP